MQEIFNMQFGSHVYGTNLPTSDHDFKGIFLPTPREILLGQGKQTYSMSTRPNDQNKNAVGDIDVELFSLKQYMKLLLEGQTVALTMLFAPKHNILQTSPIYDAIVTHKDKWLHKGINAFAGYCRQQANKYGIKGSRVAASRHATNCFHGLMMSYGSQAKLRDHWGDVELAFNNMEHCEFLIDNMHGDPTKTVRMLSVCNRKVQEHITVKEAHKIYKHLFDEYGQRALAAEKQENVDWKACMHAVRVAGEAHELLTTHHITYPRPDAPVLLQIRRGELSYQIVADLIENGLKSLEEAQQKSTLPDKPDFQFAEDFVYNAYLNIVKSYE